MLNNFFSPKSIAVIGASRNKKKLGFLVYENIRKYGFKGKLYGVNIKGGKLGAQKLYKNVGDIANEISLAVVVVPAAAVSSVLRDLGKKGVMAAIVISSGFSETGAKGKKLEKDMAEAAELHGIRILGPNCLGIIDSWSKMNASFAQTMPDKMNISFFSQSGAICTAILDWANENEIGFSRFVSLGNKTDIDENDILAYLAQDDKTDIVLSYLESIKDGMRFMANAERLSKVKPLIMVKSGTTKVGAKAISSHTGNIAGSDIAADTAIRQSGVIRAGCLEDLFDLAKIFAFSPEMKGSRIAVISNAGGPAVMLADAVSKSKLKLAKFDEKTARILEEGLPKEASCHNPIDVMGDARADRYELALELTLKDENVDGVVVVLTPQVMTEIVETAKLIVGMKKHGKPIAVCFMGGEKVEKGRRILEEKEIPSFEFPERAVKALEALYEYYNFRSSEHNHYIDSRLPTSPRLRWTSRGNDKKKGGNDKDWRRKTQFDKEKAGEIIKSAFNSRLKVIADGEESSFDVFDAYGIDTVKRANDIRLDDLRPKAEKIGYPVVLKTAAKNVLHRTDIGGVVTGIKNESELQRAYFQVRDNARKAGFDESSDKVDMYKQEESGIEIFLGAKKDGNFGPLIIFGMGGIFVEALNDFSYRIAPVKHMEAKKMISEIKSQKVLNGFRGMPEVNREKIEDAIIGLSQLMLDFPEIKEIDINPLKCTDKKCIAVDGKIVLDL